MFETSGFLAFIILCQYMLLLHMEVSFGKIRQVYLKIIKFLILKY